MTGGSRGIGAAIALTLARNGADVAISYERAADRAQDIVDQIDRDGQRGIAMQANSADPDTNERLVEHAVRDLGGLDILIDNAGTIRHVRFYPLPPAQTCPQFERSSVTGGEEHDPVVVLGVVQHLAVERE